MSDNILWTNCQYFFLYQRKSLIFLPVFLALRLFNIKNDIWLFSTFSLSRSWTHQRWEPILIHGQYWCMAIPMPNQRAKPCDWPRQNDCPIRGPSEQNLPADLQLLLLLGIGTYEIGPIEICLQLIIWDRSSLLIGQELEDRPIRWPFYTSMHAYPHT